VGLIRISAVFTFWYHWEVVMQKCVRPRCSELPLKVTAVSSGTRLLATSVQSLLVICIFWTTATPNHYIREFPFLESKLGSRTFRHLVCTEMLALFEKILQIFPRPLWLYCIGGGSRKMANSVHNCT